MKMLLHGGHIAGAINCLSRHVTPIPFVHLLLDARGRGVLNAIDPAATGLFIVGHPTLGSWGSVPANFKRPDGGVGHAFAGITQDPPPAPLTAGEFAALTTVEPYVRGAVRAYINGWDREGQPFVGLTGPGLGPLVNSITGAGKIWVSGDSWSAVHSRYKCKDGSPLIDPDTITRDIPVVSLKDYV